MQRDTLAREWPEAVRRHRTRACVCNGRAPLALQGRPRAAQLVGPDTLALGASLGAPQNDT
eukprot:10159008-Alexandrium_andersonii.AAC.1